MITFPNDRYITSHTIEHRHRREGPSSFCLQVTPKLLDLVSRVSSRN